MQQSSITVKALGQPVYLRVLIKKTVAIQTVDKLIHKKFDPNSGGVAISWPCYIQPYSETKIGELFRAVKREKTSRI